MRKMPAVLAAMVLISAAAAFPQGNFLKTGQYGLGLSGAFVVSSDASGPVGTPSVALGGLFDLAFGVGRARYDDTVELTGLRATSLSPELRAHIIKQNSSRSPVSVSVSVGHSRDNFSSPDLDAGGLRFRANSLILGATVARDVRLSGRAFLQPYAGLGHASTTFKLTNELGQTLSDKDGLATFSFGLPLVYQFSPKALAVLQPGLILSKDTTTFTAAIGLVYVLNDPPEE
jgi:hypothetical protein